MFARLLSVEFMKLRRKGVFALAVIGPLGVVLLQAVNYGLRYDYLTNLYARDPWGGLLGQVSSLAVSALFIGLALIASMSAGVEHAAGGWKQLLALPLTRVRVFAAKSATTMLLLLGSCTLLLLLTLAMGLLLGFEAGAIPVAKLLQTVYLPYIAAMPFVALQIALSLTFGNQAVPMTVGTLGLVVSMFAVFLPDWVPYGWPGQTLEDVGRWRAVAGGAAGGLLLLAAGCGWFVRRDVS